MITKTPHPGHPDPKTPGEIADNIIRTVHEDDDDFYLDEIYEDDYERRRAHAHRADFGFADGEFRHYEFWD